MAVTFRSESYASVVAATITPSEPAGAALDDVLFYMHAFDDSASSFISGPTGWTLLETWTAAAGVLSYRLYWIRRGASAPDLTTTISTTDAQQALVTCWSGCKTTGNPWNASASNAIHSAEPCAPDCPSVTTTVPNTIVIAFGAGSSGPDPGPWNPPSGYTITGTYSEFLCQAYKALASATTEDPDPFTFGLGIPDDVAEATYALEEAGGAPAAYVPYPSMRPYATVMSQ